VIYATTRDSTYALNATTCRQLWKSTYTPASVAPGRLNRGVALLDGKVFRGTAATHLIALDAKTGKTLWDTTVADATNGRSVIISPSAWNGKVFIGIAGGDLGVKGKVMALDASDGKLLWTFDLIPTGDEPGAETWGNAAATATGGGGATWSTFSIDTASGSVFIPVGNPGPDFAADTRPGANLYTCSIVVLDADTGKLRWYWQMVPHDVHDWDVAAAPALFTGSNGRPMIAVAGKSGRLYVLDGTSHRILSNTPITTLYNENAPITTAGTRFCPSTLGGAQWAGSSSRARWPGISMRSTRRAGSGSTRSTRAAPWQAGSRPTRCRERNMS
jgi:alcohol dehydrogenase (cytochrome c)